jgi:hypothetical protein
VAREVANEPVEDELREFARDEEGPAPADPAFQEKLREKLWRMLRRRLGQGEREPLD